MNITLRQLRIFEIIARHGSYTRAARELHLTQPAVSMQIKNLEEMVGLPLLERLGRRLEPTEAGRELARSARRVAAQLAETEALLEELRGLRRGRLAVAVTDAVNYVATNLIGTFLRRHRGITLRLEVANHARLAEKLEANEPELVLMGEPPPGRGLVAAPFMRNPLAVIAVADHPLARRRRVPLRALAAETLILREEGSGTRAALERFLARRGVTLTESLVMSSNEAIKQSVEAGLGLGFLSLHTVAEELERGRVVAIDVQGLPMVREWYVVHREDRRLSRAAEAFKSFVLNEATPLPGRTHTIY